MIVRTWGTGALVTRFSNLPYFRGGGEIGHVFPPSKYGKCTAAFRGPRQTEIFTFTPFSPVQLPYFQRAPPRAPGRRPLPSRITVISRGARGQAPGGPGVEKIFFQKNFKTKFFVWVPISQWIDYTSNFYGVCMRMVWREPAFDGSSMFSGAECVGFRFSCRSHVGRLHRKFLSQH